MPILSPSQQHEELKRKTSEVVQAHLPTDAGSAQLLVDSIEIPDNTRADDFRKQREALRTGRSYTVPVYGNLRLRREGKPDKTERVLLYKLPRITDRFGYIIDGKEYQGVNLLRSRQGPYHFRAKNGQLRAEYNFKQRGDFKKNKMQITLDPQTGVFIAQVGDSTVPAYALLKSLGVSDAELRKAWGTGVYEINRERSAKRNPQAIRNSMFRLLNPKTKPPKSLDGIEDEFLRVLGTARVDPVVAGKTTGIESESVTPRMLLRSSSVLLDINRGDRPQDEKSSLEFLSVASIEDMIAEDLERAIRRSKGRLTAKARTADKPSAVVPLHTLDKATRSFFGTSMAAQNDQINPLEMVAGRLRTALVGDYGGAKNSRALPEDARLLHPSQLGFLDPVHTPEGDRTGVTLSFTLGAERKGDTLTAPYRNAKTGKVERITPETVARSVVAFPDQYQKGRPIAETVKVQKDGRTTYVDPKEVDYILPSPRQVFGVSANLIPFFQNNQGNRTMTASRQAEQAVPLKYREAPKVRVKTDSGTTFEELLGTYASRRSPVSGQVVGIKDDAVLVKDKKGKRHEVQIYRNFALPGHTLYDSQVRVKVGDKVSEGDLLADTTFSKDGVLALGTGLKTAYMPYKGLNYEDGVVISESAAKKLTSLHSHERRVHIPVDVVGKRKKRGAAEDRTKKQTFLSYMQHAYSPEQFKKMSEDGTIAIGSKVTKGDPLVLVLNRPTGTFQRSWRKTLRGKKGSLKEFRDGTLRWDSDHDGVVTDVIRDGNNVRVVVKTEEAAQVGDKLVGRHGNKGVITRIIPDEEMPSTRGEDGAYEPADLLLNPLGIPGRINLGQVLETAAGKVAEKTGKPFDIKNFDENVEDYLALVESALKQAGLTDKEPLYDPLTGKPFEEDVLVGNQYIYKLHHQVDKKMAARSGSGGKGNHYDQNNIPAGGGKAGGMRMGELGNYALLGGNARKNLYEMTALKTGENTDMWEALVNDRPIPAPDVPFAYDKFLGYLNALRVDVKKSGSRLTMVPMTEEEVQTLARRELPEPGLALRGRDNAVLRGGMFDESLTGGLDGKKWTRFSLPEPMPNPVFEDAIKKLLDINGREFNAYMSGKVEVNGKRGGEALEEKLREVDLDELEKALRDELTRRKGSARSKAYHRLRIVKALKEHGKDPTVYMMRSVPVLPPNFRPLTIKEDGSYNADDPNHLYKDLGAVREAMQNAKEAGLPAKQMSELREEMYDGLKALSGIDGSLTRESAGILDTIAGKRRKGGQTEGSAKRGYFHEKLLKRRQDFSGRSTITPEPNMGLDEVGLPEEMAWKLFEPFIQRELKRRGLGLAQAAKEIEQRTPRARNALDHAVEGHPVILKRDPALHRYNTMAFMPRLVPGKSIEIHPLVTAGYGADFDGDTMSVYVPVTQDAIKEAKGMVPTNNLFSSTTGRVMWAPSQEQILGLHLMTKAERETDATFKSAKDALAAHANGQVRMTDLITVGGKRTTVGRLKVRSALPASMQDQAALDADGLTSRLVEDLMTAIAKEVPDDFDESVNALKDLGNNYATERGYSIGLDDFKVINKDVRDAKIAEVSAKAEAIFAGEGKYGKMKKAEREKEVIRLFTEVRKELDALNDAVLKASPTNAYKLVTSGAKSKPAQLKQIVSTPFMVMDAKNRTVPYIIPRSYSEGVDIGSYVTTLHGARKGTIDKVDSVRDPGYLSKQMTNSTMNIVVTEDDCGTTNGVKLGLSDADLADRYLVGGGLVTPDVIAKAQTEGKTSLLVRSPLKCESPKGVCRKCMGLVDGGKTPDIGRNVGVVAAQSLAEPAVQLSMKVFHSGGVAGAKESTLAGGLFARLSQLLRMPKYLPGATPLASVGGTVDAVNKLPQGGSQVSIGKSTYLVPAGQDLLVRKGQRVAKGQPLGNGLIRPHELLEKTNIDEVQTYLTEQLLEIIHEAKGVKRRNVEVVVRALTNVAEVDKPGDHPTWIPGTIAPRAEIEAYNRKAKDPVSYTPILKGVNALPRTMHEDWLARLAFDRLSGTIQQAAREGWSSDIHGTHPVPGLVYAREFDKNTVSGGY
jgi:DNA-directed RNA polymerase subunit beta'